MSVRVSYGITRPTAGAFLVVGLSGLLGCGGSGSGGGLVGDDRALESAMETVFSYGTAFGEVSEMLGDEVQLGFDDQGQLYILDANSFRVLLVDGEGSFVRQFGREGDGPGELSRPRHMVVQPDGSVAIFDARTRAFTLFDPEGQYSGDVRVAMGFSQTEQQVRSAGQDRLAVLGLGSDFTIPGQGARAGGATATTTQGRGGARGGQQRGGGGQQDRGGRGGQPDTIASTWPMRLIDLSTSTSAVFHEAWRPQLAEIPESAPNQGRGGRGGRGGLNQFTDPNNVGFLPSILFDGFPNGSVAVVDSSDYSIDIVAPSGQIAQVLTRNIPARPATEETLELDRVRRITNIETGAPTNLQGPPQVQGGGFGGRAGRGGDGGGRGGRGGGGPELDPQAQIEAAIESELERIETLPYAPEIPVIKNIKADPSGRLWVERIPESLVGPGPIDVFSLETGYLGTFPAGEFSLPEVFGPDGLAAFIERDEYDVPIVVVRRLGPPFE